MILLHHGIRDRDKGLGLFGMLSLDLSAAGHKNKIVGYPWQVTLRIDKAMKALIEKARDGDTIITHSNGATSACRCSLEHGLYIRQLIVIQPPLDADYRFPPNIGRVDVIYNSGDYVVEMSRAWKAAADFALPWRTRTQNYHGAMGRVGAKYKDARVRNHEQHNSLGHSGALHCAATRGEIVGLVQS